MLLSHSTKECLYNVCYFPQFVASVRHALIWLCTIWRPVRNTERLKEYFYYINLPYTMVENCNTMLYEFGSRLNQRGFTELCTVPLYSVYTHTHTHVLIAGMQTKCSLHCEGFDCWDSDLEQSHDTTNDQFWIRIQSGRILDWSVAVVISVNLKYIQHLCIEPSISYLFNNIYI